MIIATALHHALVPLRYPRPFATNPYFAPVSTVYRSLSARSQTSSACRSGTPARPFLKSGDSASFVTATSSKAGALFRARSIAPGRSSDFSTLSAYAPSPPPPGRTDSQEGPADQVALVANELIVALDAPRLVVCHYEDRPCPTANGRVDLHSGQPKEPSPITAITRLPGKFRAAELANGTPTPRHPRGPGSR